MISSLPLVMAVQPSVPAKSRSRVHRLRQGQSRQAQHGVGRHRNPVAYHGRTLQNDDRIDMLHVPYRGGAPALTDLMGGQVQVYFSPLPESISTIKGGKVRALAVTMAGRSEALPDVPTVGDFVAGYEATVWFGIGAPRNTPTDIVDKLNREINAGLADPKIKARLSDLGGEVLALSPADFAKLIADDTEKWGKVIRAANIKPE